MHLVSYATRGASEARVGALVPDRNAVLDIAALDGWLSRTREDRRPIFGEDPPGDVLPLLQAGPEMLASVAELVSRGVEVLDRRDTLPDFAEPVESIRLRPPIATPPSIRDFYAFEEHVRRTHARSGLEVPPEWYEIPAFYFSNPAAVLGPEDVVPYPRGVEELDFELEIACVIGQSGRDISAADAERHIAGYLIMNDWSARDIQQRELRVGLGPSKGKDFATSLGPALVTPDELASRRRGDRYDLEMRARVNGSHLGGGNHNSIYWTFAQMIEHASRDTELRPGDVIGSGTVGDGCITERGPNAAQGWLQPGDVIELEIDMLGTLRNTVGRRAEPSATDTLT